MDWGLGVGVRVIPVDVRTYTSRGRSLVSSVSSPTTSVVSFTNSFRFVEKYIDLGSNSFSEPFWTQDIMATHLCIVAVTPLCSMILKFYREKGPRSVKVLPELQE